MLAAQQWVLRRSLFVRQHMCECPPAESGLPWCVASEGTLCMSQSVPSLQQTGHHLARRLTFGASQRLSHFEGQPSQGGWQVKGAAVPAVALSG